MMGQTFNSAFRQILTVLLFLCTALASAQNSFTVKMNLVDARTEEPVGFATASLTVKGDKSPLKYVLADSEGKASLQKVRKGTYVLKAELLGYVTYEQEINFVMENLIALSERTWNVKRKLNDREFIHIHRNLLDKAARLLLY